jgi:uncharacterized tellurite resistance protein B-like protein
MIKSIKALFTRPSATDEAEVKHQLHLAAAALLIEMSRADYEVQHEERQTLERVLGKALGLSGEEVAELLKLASAAADRATSLYEFTRLINDHYDKPQKLTLIESMWQVAYSDRDLDKYEERLIRQVSDLIHVSHSDFIRIKLGVKDAMESAG